MFMNKRSTAKAGSLYLFASIFNKGIGFLTIPIFTRLLSTSEYGIVTTYSAWAAILTAVIGMQLNCGIRLSRGAGCPVRIEKNQELSTIFTFTLLFAILLFSITGLCTWLLPINTGLTLIALCFLEGLFTALITDYTYYQMMVYKYIARTILMILPNLIAAVLSVVLISIMTTDKQMGRIISLSSVHVVIGIVVCIMVFSKAKPQINKTYLTWAIKVSAPLILHGVALNILSQADRTMITALRSAEETGIYSLAYSFSMVATVITTGLEGIWVPWFTEKLNFRDFKAINTLSRDYIHLMVYAMVGLTLVAPEIMKLLAPSAYWEGMVLIPPLVIANFVIFAYTMYVNVEYYYERTVFITVNTIIAAITNIILNFIFIPSFGYTAATYTTLASYFVSFILHVKYAKKLNSAILPIKQYFIPMAHLIISTIFFYFFMNSWILRWGVCVVYIALILFIERKRIAELLSDFAVKSKIKDKQ